MKIVCALLMLIDIVLGTWIFLNLIVAVFNHTLVRISFVSVSCHANAAVVSEVLFPG